jgi:uncharacterized protein (DUF885 family)
VSALTETETIPNELEVLAGAYWEHVLEANPSYATSLGDRRFDDRLEDVSPDAIAARRTALAELRARADAIAAHTLPAADQMTRSALIESIAGDLAQIDAALFDWEVDPLEGPQVTFNSLEAYQPIRTPSEGRAMVARWRAMAPFVDTAIANLRRSRGDGRVAVRDPVGRVIDELDDLLARPTPSWAMAHPAERDMPGWSTAELAAFRHDLLAAIEDEVRPALARYRAVLATDILSVARPSSRPGLMHVPGGSVAYRHLVRHHTSLDLSADELHATGLAEVERIDAEFVALGRSVLGTRDLPGTLARLRSDPSLHFATREEIFAKATDALHTAQEAVPDWFGLRPAAACEVVRMEAHEEKHSTVAYYRQPALDGSRPGQYFVNTYAPETRPRYEAEALAYHEAVPGHHLQIAIGQELEGLPAFRRHLGPTAFFEGWGLYTERLADEMGIYSGDVDRFGILSFDAWRACRLVVDTGMHALAWSRDQAITYMTEHTALGENNIANEVDRYIVWPAQALAYKTGQLEILRLRATARERLGQDFRIRDFHDVVLGSGAVPLPTLRELVEAFIGDRAR